eukprot:TRINITY_DN3735_c1_g1_i6.p1 TRINITY_DN3735_c1_g1~~TRINITY_DN3735_c1_g1_i6.p1  ORF type:complete len:258 (-),score=40.86 TRINITY_DN3735_c1_g1_i6:122-895(-)
MTENKGIHQQTKENVSIEENNGSLQRQQVNNADNDVLPSAVSLQEWTMQQPAPEVQSESQPRQQYAGQTNVQPQQVIDQKPQGQESHDLMTSPFMDASPFSSLGVQEIKERAFDDHEVPEWYFSKELQDQDIVEVIVKGETAEDMYVVDKDGKQEKLTSYESAHDLSKHIVRWKSGKAVTVPEELRKDDDYMPRQKESEEDKVEADDVRFLLPRQLLFSESLDLGEYNAVIPPVSTLGPKPKPISVPQQVQEERRGG